MGHADRAIKLSDDDFRQTSIIKAKKALRCNNYPAKLVDTIFRDRIHKFYNSSENKRENMNIKNNKHFISLPFINGFSQQFQHLFMKHNIKICHKPHNVLAKHFSVLKSITPKVKKSNIVYEIPCNNCEATYIGQTSQYLENRLKSHKYDKKMLLPLPTMKGIKTISLIMQGRKS